MGRVKMTSAMAPLIERGYEITPTSYRRYYVKHNGNRVNNPISFATRGQAATWCMMKIWPDEGIGWRDDVNCISIWDIPVSMGVFPVSIIGSGWFTTFPLFTDSLKEGFGSISSKGSEIFRPLSPHLGERNISGYTHLWACKPLYGLR